MIGSVEIDGQVGGGIAGACAVHSLEVQEYMSEFHPAMVCDAAALPFVLDSWDEVFGEPAPTWVLQGKSA